MSSRLLSCSELKFLARLVSLCCDSTEYDNYWEWNLDSRNIFCCDRQRLCVWLSRFVNYKHCQMGNCSPAVATIILSVQILTRRARATDHWVVQRTHTLRPQAQLKEVLCVHTWHWNVPCVILSQAERLCWRNVFWDVSKEKWISTEMIAHAVMMSSGETAVGNSKVLSFACCVVLEIIHTSIYMMIYQISDFTSVSWCDTLKCA